MATILVVDDRLSSRQMLTTLLGYLGHQLLEADDGAEALELARTNPLDLMIADILMPTMDGFELVRRLRLDPRTKTLAVIFYTASYLESEARLLAESCGVSHIIMKPSEPEVILQTVGEALGVPVPAHSPLPAEEFHDYHMQLVTGKLSQQLEAVIPRLTAVIELGHELARERDPLRLVEHFCHAARDIIGSKFAAIGLLGEGGRTFSHFITSGMSAEEIAGIGRLPTGRGVLGRVIGADKPFRVVDISRDPQAVGFPASHPYMRSFLGAPILTSEARYGAFYFADKIGSVEFSQQDEQMAAMLAAQVGVAYENARHNDRLQREIDERKQAQAELRSLYNALLVLFRSDSLLNLGQQIVEAVVRDLKQVDCGLLLVDGDQNRMIRLARAGDFQVDTQAAMYLDGLGLVPKAVRDRAPVYAPDVLAAADYVAGNSSTRSELVVPLLTAREVLGVLDLQSPEAAAFSEQDQRILLAFAERAAAALETMQLYEEIHRYVGELEWRVAERTAELQQTKEHVEAVLNSASDAIIVVRPDGVIKNTNPSLTALLGYEPEQVSGQPLTVLFEPEEATALSAALQAIIEGQPSIRIAPLVRRADGSTLRADTLLSPIKQSGDEIEGIVCSLRDITARQQMEEDLRTALAQEKELNQLKSRFVTMISHDFRTPLSVIKSSADLLMNYANQMNEEKRQAHLSKIFSQVDRLVVMLNEILTLGKAESVGFEFIPVQLDLEVCCRNLVSETQQAAGASPRIIFTSQGTCGQALADEKIIQHVVSNLLSNAIKYSPAGGDVQFDLTCGGGQAVIQVKDSGIGIPEEDQKRLFEAFHRASNVGSIYGTGLGLAIVKRSVEMHGGTITFKSKESLGTTFTVTIPIA